MRHFAHVDQIFLVGYSSVSKSTAYEKDPVEPLKKRTSLPAMTRGRWWHHFLKAQNKLTMFSEQGHSGRWPCSENMEAIFTNIFWTKEVKAIIIMPSCFCRSSALKYVFVFAWNTCLSRSKFYLTSRHIRVKWWPKTSLQINRCGLTRWAQ